jgi:stearoyl-CoA desaturase (delta-9 desaturase)
LVAELAVSEKLKVQLSVPEEKRTNIVGLLYAPFRALAREVLLWESRDAVFHIMVVLYLAALYVGSFHHPWVPLGVLLPFMAPKSRAARYLHKLQEDLRLTQGVVVAPNVGLKPPHLDGAERWVASMNWPMVTYLSVTHLLAVYALVVGVLFGGVCPICGGVALRGSTLVLVAVLYVLSALGITGGVHRLWSHRSYKAALPLRVFLMVCNSIASQGTIYHWARDHRVHHLYSDTAADPHDATRGFFFSHCGWMLMKKRPEVVEAGKKLSMSDLEADPVVMFQKRADPFWNLLFCFFLPAYLATRFGDSFWNGFLFAGVLRYVLVLNATWAVNSVVHAFGEKPYNPGHMTTENGWVALATIGEGWHNWHHAFDWDYAAAEMGAGQQFNPTKMFIDCMAFFGLAWGRKRAHQVWSLRKQRWAEQQGRGVVESIEGPVLFRRRVVIFGPSYDD